MIPLCAFSDAVRFSRPTADRAFSSVRVLTDGEKKWEDPIEIISTGNNSYKMNDPSKAGNAAEWGTCSYSDIVPLSDNEALIVYTDFFVPDENGIKRKSLMVIKATVTD